MAIVTKTHKIIIWILILLSLFGLVAITIYEYAHGEVLSITDTQIVTVTSDAPHLVTIQIKPESRIPPTGNDSVPLTVEIRPTNSLTALTTITVTSDNNGYADLGSISTATVPPGVYDVAIKGLSHLRKVFPDQDFEGPAVRSYLLLIPQLPAGDTNPTADNYVNSLDISYVTTKLYGNDVRADLTHDGIVNSLDYAALLRNLGFYGDN